MSYANSKGADQPVHPRSLISAFVVRSLDSTISLVSRNFKILASFSGCAGRFVSGLVGNSRRHVLSCRGSIMIRRLVCGIFVYTMQNKFSDCFCIRQIHLSRLVFFFVLFLFFFLSLYCIKIQVPITKEEFAGIKIKNDQLQCLY